MTPSGARRPRGSQEPSARPQKSDRSHVHVSTASTRHSAGPLAAPILTSTITSQSPDAHPRSSTKHDKKRFGGRGPCDRTASFPCRHEANPTLQAFWSGPSAAAHWSKPQPARRRSPLAVPSTQNRGSRGRMRGTKLQTTGRRQEPEEDIFCFDSATGLKRREASISRHTPSNARFAFKVGSRRAPVEESKTSEADLRNVARGI